MRAVLLSLFFIGCVNCLFAQTLSLESGAYRALPLDDAAWVSPPYGLINGVSFDARVCHRFGLQLGVGYAHLPAKRYTLDGSEDFVSNGWSNYAIHSSRFVNNVVVPVSVTYEVKNFSQERGTVVAGVGLTTSFVHVRETSYREGYYLSNYTVEPPGVSIRRGTVYNPHMMIEARYRCCKHMVAAIGMNYAPETVSRLSCFAKVTSTPPYYIGSAYVKLGIHLGKR